MKKKKLDDFQTICNWIKYETNLLNKLLDRNKEIHRGSLFIKWAISSKRFLKKFNLHIYKIIINFNRNPNNTTTTKRTNTNTNTNTTVVPGTTNTTTNTNTNTNTTVVPGTTNKGTNTNTNTTVVPGTTNTTTNTTTNSNSNSYNNLLVLLMLTKNELKNGELGYYYYKSIDSVMRTCIELSRLHVHRYFVPFSVTLMAIFSRLLLLLIHINKSYNELIS